MNAVNQFSLTPIPGQHVPKCVVRALAKVYPTVRIVWNYFHRQWQLIERMKNGQWGDITLVNGSPTIENTIGLLVEIDNAQMQTPAEIDQFLAKLDQGRTDAEAKRILTLQDAARQVGEAVWDAKAGKIRIAPWRRSSRRR